MLDARLYILQRFSAIAMAPFVLIHLGVMIYAIQGGLSAGEILGRTQGSIGWMLFYAAFVFAASLHGAIGLRVITHEWFGLRDRKLTILTWSIFAILVFFGLRAIAAVTVI